MELKFKKSKSFWLSKPFTVPVSEQMKDEASTLKKEGYDINQMMRDHLQKVIDQAKVKKSAKV